MNCKLRGGKKRLRENWVLDQNSELNRNRAAAPRERGELSPFSSLILWEK